MNEEQKKITKISGTIREIREGVKRQQSRK